MHQADLAAPGHRAVPPGRAIADDLAARITAGEFAPGEQLPPNAALAGAYGVARRTVNRALRSLEDAGLVTITARWGSFVARPAGDTEGG
jgi:DNA-binding GntR family transcriptional regulator